MNFARKLKHGIQTMDITMRTAVARLEAALNGEEVRHMASNPETGRSGQAMTEFVVAILAIVLVISATVEFLPVLLKNI